jgi:hypothetical protein
MADFALNPTDAIQGVIDWETPIGATIAKHAIKQLHESKFNGSPEDLHLFLTMFELRGKEFGWYKENSDFAIALIQEDPEDEENTKVFSITEHYGSLDRDLITRHETSYLFSDQESAQRAAQDNRLAFRCIQNSLGIDILKKVLIKKTSWQVEDPNDEGTYKESAMLLLKTVIDESAIQTNATASSIRTRLADLHNYITQIDSDVIKFNEYVEQNLAALTARGEQTTDLLVYLWKAYTNVSDASFADYMKRSHEAYEMSNDEISPKALMDMASNKYKLMKENGTWNEPSETQKKIIALEAELASWKKKPHQGKTHKTQGKKQKASTKSPYTKKKGERPEAMSTKPTNLKQVVQWKGKPWYYCCKENGGKCDGAWRAHKPSDCKGPDFLKKKETGGKDDTQFHTKSKREKLERAMSALVGEDDSE